MFVRMCEYELDLGLSIIVLILLSLVDWSHF